MQVSKSLRIGLAALALMGLCGTSSAAPLVLGNSSPGNASPGPTVAYLDILSFSNATTPTPSGVSIDDKWYFNQLEPFYLADAAVSFNFFTNFRVLLYGPTGGTYGVTGLVWDSGILGASVNETHIPYTLLADIGTYFIEVMGTST